MISPQAFLDKWNSEIYGLVQYEESSLQPFILSEETRNFLLQAGFPESAPPFLTFESSAEGGGARVTQYNDLLDEAYERYIYLGFTGSGSPVCIDESNGEVVFIDGDNENARVFMNSSIPQLAESLLVYVEFINKVNTINGRGAFLDKNAPKESLDWVCDRLLQVDQACLIEVGFWEEELAGFRK